MIARTFWGARAGKTSDEKSGVSDSKPSVNDALDPSAAEDVDALDLAVQKLSEGLEAIERQGRAAAPTQPSPVASNRKPYVETPESPEERAAVASTLDRLEARLEALSRRLEQRGGTAPARKAAPFAAKPEAAGPDPAAQLAESRRLAEAEEARIAAASAKRAHDEEQARVRREAEAEERRRRAILEDARRNAEEIEARREAELAEARRAAEDAEARRAEALAAAKSEADAAAARLRAEAAEARRAAEAAEARRRQEAEEAAAAFRRQTEEAEAERRRMAEEAEAVRLADIAEARRQAEAAESRRRAELEAARREAEEAAARGDAELAASLGRQLAAIEARIEALQDGLDENQIEPVRDELIEIVKEMAELSRNGRATADTVAAVSARLDETEAKLASTRSLAGSRLGEIQDRLTGLVGRIEEIEIEVPGFDAVRENQGAILERFDRIEGLVHRLASQDELVERVEGLKRQLQTLAPQREVVRIEEHILNLADRLDALPRELSDEAALARIEAQLGGLAAELAEARQQRKSTTTEAESRLLEISRQLDHIAETGRTPDLGGIEERLAAVGASLADDRRSVGDTLNRIERRVGSLSEAVEAQEATAEILTGLAEKVDRISAAVEAQDAAGARRDIGGVDRKLDQLAAQLSAQAENLSREQIKPLEARLDEMQAALRDIAEHTQDSAALFRPLVQKLQEISEHFGTLGAAGAKSPLSKRLESIEAGIAGLGKGSEQRALQTQLEAVMSRLETLKGRSIDPARLNDLFDRIEVAIRALTQERFERLEQEQDAKSVPNDRFDRLEKKIVEAGGVDRERLARLEAKLDEVARAYTAGGETLPSDALAELRSDIVALRRDMRASGATEGNLGELMRAIAKRLEKFPQDVPQTIAGLEAQMDRIARLLDDPERDSAGLARVQASLKAIERRLDDTRRSLDVAPAPVLQSEPSEEPELPEEPEPAPAPIAAVAARTVALDRAIAQKSSPALLDDETSEAPEAPSEKNTIDAVQDTLEAVVKRMAFLERDADSTERRAEEPQSPPREAPEEIPEVAPAAPAQPTGGGLLSRFTSRQLLRRATGGRAESFSPEESDEASDFPLEPGTDAPLSSSLSGAPSSDTEFMSGARRSRPARPTDRVSEQIDLSEEIDDDFLAAARRAARAASAEIGEDTLAGEDDEAGQGSVVGRRVLIAAIVVVILVAAAAGAVWTRLVPLDPITALLSGKEASLAPSDTSAIAPEAVEAPPAPKPVATTTVSGNPNGDSMLPTEVAPAETAPAAPAGGDDATASAPAAATGDATPAQSAVAPQETASAEAPADAAAAASTAPAPAGPSGTTAPAATASAEPEATTPAATPSASGAEGGTVLASLPEAIGPEKLRAAALAGNAAAAFEIGARYAEGHGVPVDMQASVAWYGRAADSGLAPAQYRLGSIYEKGLGVPKDLAKAQDWYKRAADAGNVKAMHNLAVLYAEGAGGQPDLEHAAQLFREAAEHGVRDSQFNLAILSARGLGIPQNLVEAYKWFAVAATSGDEESAKRRDIIAQALTKEDLAKAKGAAATFQPQPFVASANEVAMPEGGWGVGDNSTSVEVNSNELVALVQKLLAQNGYDPGPPDGLLGAKTIDAISAFQGKSGLPQTGQIDTGLVEALQKRST